MSDLGLIPFREMNSAILGQAHCFDGWREAVRPFFDVEPLEGAAIGNEWAKAWLIDSLVFTETGFSRQSHSHHLLHAKNSNYLFLQVYRSGGQRGIHADIPFKMMPGEIHIRDFSREYHSVAEDAAIISLIIPHSAVGYDPGRHPVHIKFARDSAAGGFLRGALFALGDQLPTLRQKEASIVADGFYGLVRGLLNPQLGRPEE